MKLSICLILPFCRNLSRSSQEVLPASVSPPPSSLPIVAYCVCIVDLAEDRLQEAAKALAEVAPDGADSVMTSVTDVSSSDAVLKLDVSVRERFGGADILMNNAGDSAR